EQQPGDDQHVPRAERADEPDGERRAGERARRAAGGDEAEEALALLARVEIGHERPEDRYRKEIEDADPDEEAARHPLAAGIVGEQSPEDRDVDGEEVIDRSEERR